MDDLLSLIIGLVVLAVLVSLLILPIVSLVISINTRKRLTREISRLQSGQTAIGGAAQPASPADASLAGVVQRLTVRLAKLEAAVTAQPIATETDLAPAPETRVEPIAPPPLAAQRPGSTTAAPARELRAEPASAQLPPKPIRARTIEAEQIESIIGRRRVGWAAVALILFATAFFLKYAFDNRWIGELGRVAIGVAAGVTLNVLGFRYYRRRWRIFSQILTAGGIVLLYLSAYAAFGYYHLATQKAAFVYLAILIAEAAGLALLYEAPAIAIMALIGGFLVPILLRSDRDQYRSLFGYIAALDIGALALLKRWWGLSSIAFAGTHLLFWLWYVDHYHPRKLGVVMTFQTGVFLIFLLSHLGRRLFKPPEAAFDDLGMLLSQPLRFFVAFEDLALLSINPFVFFATSYGLLNSRHHDWMAVFAIGMALVYAGAAKVLLDRRATRQSELLLMIGIALTFVTLAIPIQLRANWITIAWSLEALAMLWAGLETRSPRLRVMAHTLFALVLLRLVFWDTPFDSRPIFTPVVNKYFLSSLVVVACLFAAALAYQKLGPRRQIAAPKLKLVILFVALVMLWLIMSVETSTFFAARAALQKVFEDARHERWLGQMALSVLWSVYAAILAAAGFVRRAAALRWAALVLFAFTVVKVMLVDIAVLQQLYRIIAFLVLGLLLLVVAWGYHKAFHSREAST